MQISASSALGWRCTREGEGRGLVLARELEDRQGEVARVGAEETGSANVPGDGSGNNTKAAASLLDLSVGGELGNEQEKEGEVQEDYDEIEKSVSESPLSRNKRKKRTHRRGGRDQASFGKRRGAR